MALLNNQFLINGAQVPDTSGAVSDYQSAKFNQMKIAAAQAEAANQAAIKQARIDANGDPTKMAGLLNPQGIDPTKIQTESADLQSKQAGVQKTTQENALSKFNGINNAITGTLAKPTVANAHDQINNLQQTGFLTQDEAVQAHATVPKTDAEIVPWAQSHALANMKDGGQLAATNPKSDVQDLGGIKQQILTSPLTGMQTQGQSYNKTATPGEILSAATAGIKAAQANDKPVPAPVLKLRQDTGDEFVGLGNAQNRLDKAISDIQGNLNNFGLIHNAYYKVRNGIGQSTPESQAYANMISTAQQAVNDSLRLNKGVQTEGDATRQYVGDIGSMTDPQVLLNHLQYLRQKNQDRLGVLTDSMNQIDQNYSRNNDNAPTPSALQSRSNNTNATIVPNPLQPQQPSPQPSSPSKQYNVQQSGAGMVINGRSYSGAQLDLYAQKHKMTKDQVIAAIQSAQ